MVKKLNWPRSPVSSWRSSANCRNPAITSSGAAGDWFDAAAIHIDHLEAPEGDYVTVCLRLSRMDSSLPGLR
jgi:hypothetical protein